MKKIRSKKFAEWQGRVRLWKESGLSQYAWCKRNKVSHSNFRYWSLRILGSLHDNNKFVELPSPRGEPLNISLQSKGISISLHHGFDERCLLRILRAIGEE
jgi:hypothetical protein